MSSTGQAPYDVGPEGVGPRRTCDHPVTPGARRVSGAARRLLGGSPDRRPSICPAYSSKPCRSGSSSRPGDEVQRQRAQVVTVDQQLERVVPRRVEPHAVHLQDDRRRAHRHPRERREPGRELALQGRHHVLAVGVEQLQLQAVVARLGRVRLHPQDEHHRRIGERKARRVDRVELPEDVELALTRHVRRIAEDREVDLHSQTILGAGAGTTYACFMRPRATSDRPSRRPPRWSGCATRWRGGRRAPSIAVGTARTPGPGPGSATSPPRSRRLPRAADGALLTVFGRGRRIAGGDRGELADAARGRRRGARSPPATWLPPGRSRSASSAPGRSPTPSRRACPRPSRCGAATGRPPDAQPRPRRDRVVTATRSRDPVLRDDWLGAGICILALGATRPDQRELDYRTIVRAATVITDAPRRRGCAPPTWPRRSPPATSTGSRCTPWTSSSAASCSRSASPET